MALDLGSVGTRTDATVFDYNWRDTVLYALGVGATATEDYDFLYEGRGPLVLPTFATIAAFSVFDELVERIGCDPAGLVHERQSLRVFGPLPAEAKLTVVGRVQGLYDLRRLATGTVTVEVAHNGTPLAEAEMGLVFRNDGGFGGSRPPKRERTRPPEREPDFVAQDETQPTQALLYRLNGDLNPLHADPAFAKRVGFDAPILHGLCTFGYACRALVRLCCGGDPTRLREVHAQFREPVLPGSALQTRAWKNGEQVLFETTTGEGSKVSLAGAYATCVP